MQDSRYEIRPYRPADYEAEAQIDREIDPEHPMTAKELRHWNDIQNLEPTHANLKLAIEDRGTGTMVGYGSLTQRSFNFVPGWFWVWVAIAPAHRNRGAGSMVYDRLVGEARARSGIGLWGNTRERDPGGVRFFQRRGFRTLRKLWHSRLDLTTLDLSRIPDRSVALQREGFRFSTLAEEGASSPEVRRSVYRLATASGKDIPRMGGHRSFSFEEYMALDVDAPGSMAEGIFLLWKGSEVIGMSSLERELARPDTLRVGYTGTSPGFRRKGIGTELKRRAAAFAIERGYRYLVTGNDSMNEPILAINERSGFRAETVWILGEKQLGG